MSSELDLLRLQRQIYLAASCRRRPPNDLFRWLVEPVNLNAAWRRVASCEGAATAGPDGMTCDDIRPDLENWLASLQRQLVKRRFRASPPRWVDVPKSGGSGNTRRLGILNVSDRVVHAAVKQVLEPILEPAFSPASFGFRPGRGTASALATATRWLARVPNGQVVWGKSLDVRKCFASIAHRPLHTELRQRVADRYLRALVRDLVDAGTPPLRFAWARYARGLVEGGALSPLLCNVALDPLDRTMAAQRVVAAGQACYLRYADDVLLLATDSQHLDQLVCASGPPLRAMKLRWGTAPHWQTLYHGIEWLGMTLCAPQGRPANTAQIIVSNDTMDRMLQRLERWMRRRIKRHVDGESSAGHLIQLTNQRLMQWREAYRFADNARALFARLDELAEREIARAVRRVQRLEMRTRKSKASSRGDAAGNQAVAAVTNTFGKTRSTAPPIHPKRVPARYRVKLAGGQTTWQVAGRQLVVLSTMPVKRVRLKPRPPRWQQTPQVRRNKKTK